MDLELLEDTSLPFPKVIETCLQGMILNMRNVFFRVQQRLPFLFIAT